MGHLISVTFSPKNHRIFESLPDHLYARGLISRGFEHIGATAVKIWGSMGILMSHMPP